VTEPGLSPTQRLSSTQVLSRIAQGGLGFASRVRRPSETEWGRAADRLEFGWAFPYFNLPSGRRKKDAEVVGHVALNPSPERALGVAAQLASDPRARNLNFWYSGYLDWIPAPLVRRARLFELWDGFWLAPLVESSYVKQGSWLNVYLLAFNLTEREQQRSLRPAKSEIAEGMKGNLTFVLPPWRWTVQLVSVPAVGAPGGHVLEFNSRSGAERAATAAVVGVLTLGNFVYAPGSKGVSLQYQVLPADTARILEAWESYALQSAASRFDAAQATAVSDRNGGRIPKDVVLQKFRAYLTPTLLYAAMQDPQRPADQAVPTLLDELLFDWLGHASADEAFLKG
jgi:hypothetical protein